MGRAQPRARRHVDRGPSRALRVERARARPAAGGHRRLRRRRPHPRARRAVLARQRRLHPLRDHRPDHHRHPAARALQAGRLPGRVLVALHQHRARDAVPGGGPAPGVLRHGADDGCRRGAPRPRPRRGAVPQLHPARRDALRPGADVPGRAAAALRLGGLPGIPGQAQGARRLGRLRRLPRAGRARGTPRRPRHRVLRRGHRRRPLRGRARARRDERAGQRRHRPDDPGPGAPDDPRPDRRRRARGAAGGRARHHR